MSRVQRKLDESLDELLVAGEQILRRVNGVDGLKPATMALTDRRLLFIRQGATIFSTPGVRVVELADVRKVDVEPGLMTAPDYVKVEARSGMMRIGLSRADKKTASLWPNWILDAQRAISTPQPAASGDTDLAHQIERLQELHTAGALTDEEFAQAKRRLLS